MVSFIVGIYVNNKLKTCGATRNPEFPRTRPDRTETSSGSGNIFKEYFRVGSGLGILFRIGRGRGRPIFYRGMRHFSRYFGDKLES